MTASPETSDAEVEARKLLDEFRVTAPGPLNLAPIARRFGAEAFESQLYDCSAKLVWSSTGQHIIRVNARDSLQRKAFSVAHEIGHLVRASEGPVWCSFSGEADRRGATLEERWANEFAAALLMPVHLLGPLVAGQPVTMATAKRISRLCGVSRVAAAARLPDLAPTPCLFARHADEKATWIEQNSRLGSWVLRDGIPRGSTAFALMETNAYTFGPEPVSAAVWFDGHDVDEHVLIEDSTYCGGSVYTLLECVGRVGDVPVTVAPADPDATVIEYRKGRRPFYRRRRAANVPRAPQAPTGSLDRPAPDAPPLVASADNQFPDPGHRRSATDVRRF